jgi:hypothetical protein
MVRGRHAQGERAKQKTRSGLWKGGAVFGGLLKMENQQIQRLLYDKECQNCDQETICEWANTPQSYREITDKLRIELRNNRRQRKIVAKISIVTEYINTNHKLIKNVAKEGKFVLQEPYRFGTPFYVQKFKVIMIVERFLQDIIDGINKGNAKIPATENGPGR